MSFRSSFLARSAQVAAAIVPFALLTGCALTDTAPPDTTIASMSGIVHGGQSGIQGSTVTLYVTNSAAATYGAAGTVIGSATSDVYGNFTISPSATSSNCPSGQQAYITAAGGYPSAQPTLANNSTLLMAALGPCSGISSSTRIDLDEITTVAAAYALSGFMTTSASGSIFKANIGAPALNNAATASATAASGLPHAFLNAATLANYVTGQANPLTANITVGATTVNGIIPLAEINALGDILQSCVNGATGNASCTSLFSLTPSISGVAPLNTLQAMIYLARNPYPSAAAMNATTGLFSLISSSPAFVPVLSANPPDWSMAIVYTNATSMPAQYFIALDANDTVYTGSSAKANIAALSAYGTATPAYTSAGTATATRQIAPDALGNVWVAGYQTGQTTTNVYQYSASTGGSPTALPVTSTASEVYGVAVDASNNVWVSNANAVTPNIIEYKYAAGTPATYTANYTATVPSSFEPVALTIDGNQNVWAAPYYTNATVAMVLPNLSAATPLVTPTYTVTGTTVTPVSATFASSADKPLGLAVDASGNAWYGIVGTNTLASAGVEEVIPTLSSSVITSITPQALVSGSTIGTYTTGIPGIDGAGTLFLSDNLSSTESTALGVHVYSTVSTTSSSLTASQVLSPPSGYLGCYLATATTTACGAVGGSYPSAIYNPREAAIDSTGSVWVGITSGGFTQLIGLGAPSWPLLATGKPGLSPGLIAVTPLP